MKHLCAVWLLVLSLHCFSQAVSIESYPLQVTVNKTTTIIFPSSIRKVNIGSADVVGQIVKLADTILQIKAARKDFQPTNMSVITADGRLYPFLVTYANDPATLNLSLMANRVSIPGQKHFLDISMRDQQMKLSLQSIYISQQVLWFTFSLDNYSLIDFKPGYIKFFLADNRKVKRTAEQETELVPSFQTAVSSIPGKGRKELIIGFPQFTIPKDKRMVCQVSEHNGGRLLALPIGYKTLLKARAPL